MTGRGPTPASAPRVFLPGAGGRAEFWEPVAARLGGRAEPILLGWPGFGGIPPDASIRDLDDLYRWMCARLPPGRSDVVAQSMGGVLAARLAIERPERVRRLVLAATSGGLDLASLGARDWRPEYRRELRDVPPWFADDRTDLTERLQAIAAPTLLLWSDADAVSPVAAGELLARCIPGARLHLVRGGTHAFAHERPDEVAAIIGEFLEEGGGEPA